MERARTHAGVVGPGDSMPPDREDTASAGPPGLVAHFFRHESGRLVASLTRRYGPARLEMVEDAVQAALASALARWRADGIPKNPSAWLWQVAHNKLRDQLRRSVTARDAAPRLATDEVAEPAHVGFNAEIADDMLRMLFVCCDEALKPKAQLVLSLKLLCGFGTREIAASLFLTEANVHKLLSRGRDQLREIWQRDGHHPDIREAEWLTPDGERMGLRLPAVQHVVYLLFTEGHSSHTADEVIRRDLCEEALRLGQLLVSHPVADTGESWALLALMHFHLARLDARTDEEGGLLMLEEQDRTRWDRHHIQLGMHCLTRADGSEQFSRYHAEAAISAEHCLAKTFDETRWDRIVGLYEMLEHHAPSPMHALNRAIAVAAWKGPEAGLALLREVAPPTWLVRHYLWDATMGELMRKAGKLEQAAPYLERAMEQAPTQAEKQVMRKRLGACR